MIPFLPFAARLGYTPEPGQEAALRVLFGGEEPGDAGPLAVRFFGYERGTPPRARDVAELVWGARGGKSFWGALRMLHLACTVRLDRLAPGEHGYVFLVAPKLELAGQPLAYIKGAIWRDKALASMADVTAERIVLELHMAKANPQWQQFFEGEEAMAVFSPDFGALLEALAGLLHRLQLRQPSRQSGNLRRLTPCAMQDLAANLRFIDHAASHAPGSQQPIKQVGGLLGHGQTQEVQKTLNTGIGHH